MIAVNLKGAFLGQRYVLEAMVRRRSGAVVNTASTGGLRGAPLLAPYVASKHGVLGLPGADRDAHDPLDRGAALGLRREPLPAAQTGRPEDVANLVLFLLSDLAGNITGAEFTTDGGRTALPGTSSLARV